MLFTTLTALSFLLPPKPNKEVKVLIRPGEQVELQVLFPKENLLLNREAPNILKLHTPWEKITVLPSGTPHTDHQFRTYFGQVNPMKFKLKIPKKAALGKYQGQLKAEFFVCQLQHKQCTKRTLHTKVHIHITETGQAKPLVKLQLKDHDLKSTRLPAVNQKP